MKILFVAKNYRLGTGDMTYAFNLERLLVKRGHEIAYFAMEHPLNKSTPYSKYFVSQIDFAGSLHEKNLSKAIKVFTRALYSFEAKNKIKKLLENFKPDIVHIHHLDTHLSYSILPVIKTYSIPVVWSLHIYAPICINYNLINENTGEICEDCKQTRFYKATINKCKKSSLLASLMGSLFQYFNLLMGFYNYVDLFLCPSNFIKNKFIEFGFPPDKLHQLNYFIDSSIIKPQYDGDGYGLYFGRLDPEKGVGLLLQALKGTDIPFKIVGDGQSKETCIRTANNLGLKNVEFLGARFGEELFNIVSRANFIVIPSTWYEVVGLVMIEAFTYGKPVIGSRIGGITEVIKDNETGFLFDHTDPDDLRDKIMKLYKHPILASEMGKRARIWVEREYNHQLHYTNLMKVYSTFVN